MFRPGLGACTRARFAQLFNGLLGALIGALAACSSSDPPPNDNGNVDAGKDVEPDVDNDSGTDLGYKPCPVADEVGEFRVQLAMAFTGVQGQVFDGVVPANVPEVLAEEGSCRVLHGRSFFCDPPCGTEETCDADGECIPYPRAHTVGTVDVSGLLAPLSMEPSASFLYTNPPGFPHPGFDTGAALGLHAAGGDFEAFSLKGEGVVALELGPDTPFIARDAAAELTWEPPASPSPAKIHVDLNINKHGTRADWIECEAEDTGSFSIPATLVTALMDVGVSGFPTLTLTRRTADSTDIDPGCVEFLVVSERAVAVDVDGVTSCDDDTDCPTGQTCQIDLTCR